MKLKCKILIAADEPAFSLLKNEFPSISFLPVKGYRIKFNTTKKFLSWSIISQFPSVLSSIYKERKWVNKIINQYNIDGVISDNRFGFYSKKIPSVYITHQLAIKTGNKFSDKIGNYIHRYFINRYKECWVPDFENENLAGELSHPKTLPGNIKYIGALSRFKRQADEPGKYKLIIILSGPEPQRSIFEKLMMNNLEAYYEKTLLVRGLPNSTNLLQSENTFVEIANHIGSENLCKAIQQSDIVISRSGYSTIMDLIKLNKKAILIPTPGQNEQEYLGSYLMKKKIFFCIEQNYFELKKAIEMYSRFPFIFPEFNMQQYKAAVKKFVELLADKPSK